MTYKKTYIFAALLVASLGAAVGVYRVVYSDKFRIDLDLKLTDATLHDYRSLFEIVDKSGKVQCAAGFARGSQTYRTINDRQVEFYCDVGEPVISDLGRPSANTWRPSLAATPEGLVDLSSGMMWTGEKWSLSADSRKVENHQDLGAKIAFVAAGSTPARVDINGEPVLSFESEIFKIGTYYNGLIYTVSSGKDGSSFLGVFRPATGETERLEMPATRGVYAIMGYDGSIIISGTHWILRYDGNEISTLFKHPEYEFYSLLSTRDGILAGSYPGGDLYLIDPDTWTVSSFDHPPKDAAYVNDGSVESLTVLHHMGEKYYREIQSLALYGGRLYAGLFPTGTVWEKTDRWVMHSMFNKLPDQSEPWPYYSEMQSRIADLNADERARANPKWLLDAFWARRVSSLVPSPQGLAIGVGNFTGFAFDPDRDTFMSQADVEEYGRVKLLERPAVLSAFVDVKGQTTLSFVVSKDRKMLILQDGQIIAETDAPMPKFRGGNVRVGSGVYGATSVPLQASRPNNLG